MRLVFDDAAKVHGTSSNDNLLSGIHLLKKSEAVFSRFCLGKYAAMADIKTIGSKYRILTLMH